MSRVRSAKLLLLVNAALLAAAAVAQGANEGQADLDRATELQVTAQSMNDLEQVIGLCDSALKKGLDEANALFAKQLLSSTLYQRGQQLCRPIFEQSPPDERWQLLRQFALRDLERVIELEPTLAAAHLLIARLHVLPGGDNARGEKAASAAVKLQEEQPKEQSAALVILAQFRENMEDRLKDYARAIELDPSNTEAWQSRALTYMQIGDFAKALEDLNRILQERADDPAAHLAVAEALLNLEKYDEALSRVEQALQLDPKAPSAYSLRARLHLLKENAKAALEDLNRAIEQQPRDLAALLLRSRLRQDEKDLAGAMEDVERVLLLSPELPQALLIRSMIYADQGRIGDAVADIQRLLTKDPGNIAWQLQLAGYYLQDKRPTKALEIFDTTLQADKENFLVRQARADTFLSIGKHAEAIADFEILLQQQPEDDSILNNFAWVLATSPEDSLRDGPRAIKLATKACEVTEFKRPHILSTLGAAYAETGDFETAIKWSEKAVELGADDEQVDQQLQQELESYRQKKPWRERQTVEEKPEPVQPRRSRFEA